MFQSHFPSEIYSTQPQLPSKPVAVSQNSNVVVENLTIAKSNPPDLSRISEDSHQQSPQVF